MAVTGHPSGSSGLPAGSRGLFFRRLTADDGSDACPPIVRRRADAAPIRLLSAALSRLAGLMANPGYDGMWLPQDQDPRAEAGQTRGERDTLVGYLEAYRT